MTRTFTEAIADAIEDVMLADSRVHVLGLGASYLNGLDGTMRKLGQQYPDRVHDTPCSEAAVTGAAVGMAISGLRPIVHHGRAEFAFFAMDQIVTQAAKWRYQFGGNYPCPLTIRIALGRQWGNGPQHTQAARAQFAVPGLRVVAPSSPNMAYKLLRAAVACEDPVIFLEHRWLYKTREEQGFRDVFETPDRRILEKVRVLQTGDVMIAAAGDMVLEALCAAYQLRKEGLSVGVVDAVSIYPLDLQGLQDALRGSRHVLVVDSSSDEYLFNAISSVWMLNAERDVNYCVSLTPPECPCPTATSLTAAYYPSWRRICTVIKNRFFYEDTKAEQYSEPTFAQLHHAPTDNFTELERA